MTIQKIVAAVAAAALALGSVGSFAQSYNGKEQDEQRAREQAARGQGQPPPGADVRRDPRGNGYNNAPAANARDNYRGDNRVDNRRDYRNDNRPEYRGGYRNDDRGGYRSGYRGDYRSDYRDGHSWHRGDRLPPEYRSRQYVVDDWRGHHLSAPPRGYQWVQAGGDYVLVAVATGIIASILLSQ